MRAGVKRILDANVEEDRKILEDRASEIDVLKENKEMREIISDLKRTMRKGDNDTMLSLAAPEIGRSRRIFCVNWADQGIKTYIDPAIVTAEGFSLSREESNILPGKSYIRPRSNKVHMEYMTPTGKIESRDFTGKAAFLMQNNIDLLDGLFLSDIGLEINEDFDKATQEEREEVLAAYLDELDVTKEKVDEVLSNDEDYTKFVDAIKFMQGVRNGSIKTEQMDELKEELPEEPTEEEADN